MGGIDAGVVNECVPTWRGTVTKFAARAVPRYDSGVVTAREGTGAFALVLPPSFVTPRSARSERIASSDFP